MQGLADQVPDDFRFGFKVTDLITIKKIPNHARHGAKAGQVNADFLNADLFATAFLKPCEENRSKIGVLMFEFSRFTDAGDRTIAAPQSKQGDLRGGGCLADFDCRSG